MCIAYQIRNLTFVPRTEITTSLKSIPVHVIAFITHAMNNNTLILKQETQKICTLFPKTPGVANNQIDNQR